MPLIVCQSYWLGLLLFALNSEAAFLMTEQKLAATPITVPGDIEPDQVGNFVAPLSEQQVRELLITRLQTQAAIYADEQARKSLSVIELLQGVNNPDSPLGSGIRSTVNATASF